MTQRTYRVEGLHCGSCVAKVEEALRGVEGVTGARVSLQPPRAVLELSRPVELPILQDAVSRRGKYTLSALSDEPVTQETESKRESLFPLFLIVGYILGAVVIVEWRNDSPSWMNAMRLFMAGFFLVFSFFKMLDLPGFVSAYRGYDLLARGVPGWAWLYPFVELGLGIAFLMKLAPLPVNWFTLALMLLGAAGVINALLHKQRIRCACLGTALNLPMTKVTLIEDLTMAAMACAMIARHGWID